MFNSFLFISNSNPNFSPLARISLRFSASSASMASEAEISEISSLFETMLRNSLFLPFIVGFSTETEEEEEEEDQRDPERGSSRAEGIILINPLTQRMVVIERASSLDALLLQGMGGQPPASKASIEAIPVVEVVEGEDDGECVICLENWVCGDSVKEMPCKHKFHGCCIEKWLKIHGCCPVCRFAMPVEEGVVLGKKREDERREEEEDGGHEVWVSFGINGGRSSDSDSELNQDSFFD